MRCGIGVGVVDFGSLGGVADIADGSLAAFMLANETQGLAIDFTDLSMQIKDTGTPANNFSGDPNSKLTYTSPSTKWILGKNGLYSSGTTLRTEYDTSALPIGVRAEDVRTNVCPNDFASWSPRNGGTITANAAAGPTGFVNATKIEDSSAGALRGATLSGIAVNAASIYTLSAFIKADTGSGIANLNILFSGGTPVEYGVVVDLATGNTLARTGVGTPTAFGATLDANGYYRVYVTCSSGTGNSAAVLDLYTAWNSALSGGLSVAAVGSVLASSPQLELGPVATSPIATAGSTVTRAADLVTMLLNLMPSLGSAYTIAAKWRPLSATFENRVIRIDDGTANEIVAIGNTSAGAGSAWVVDGGSNQTAPLTDGTISASASNRCAISVAPNDIRMSVNGAAQVTDATATLPTPTTLRLGPVGSMVIEKLLVLPRTSTGAELQGYLP